MSSLPESVNWAQQSHAESPGAVADDPLPIVVAIPVEEGLPHDQTHDQTGHQTHYQQDYQQQPGVSSAAPNLSQSAQSSESAAFALAAAASGTTAAADHPSTGHLPTNSAQRIQVMPAVSTPSSPASRYLEEPLTESQLRAGLPGPVQLPPCSSARSLLPSETCCWCLSCSCQPWAWSLDDDQLVVSHNPARTWRGCCRTWAAVACCALVPCFGWFRMCEFAKGVRGYAMTFDRRTGTVISEDEWGEQVKKGQPDRDGCTYCGLYLMQIDHKLTGVAVFSPIRHPDVKRRVCASSLMTAPQRERMEDTQPICTGVDALKKPMPPLFSYRSPLRSMWLLVLKYMGELTDDALAEAILPGVLAEESAAAAAERAAPAARALLHSATRRLARRLMPVVADDVADRESTAEGVPPPVGGPRELLAAHLETSLLCDSRTQSLFCDESVDLLAALIDELYAHLQPLFLPGASGTSALYNPADVLEEACGTVRAFVARRERLRTGGQ